MHNLILTQTVVWKEFDIAYGVGIFGLIFILFAFTFYISNKAQKKIRDAESGGSLFSYGLAVMGSFFGLWIVLGNPGISSLSEAGFGNYIAFYGGILASLFLFVPVWAKIVKISDRYRVNSFYLFLVKRYGDSNLFNILLTSIGFVVLLPIIVFPIHIISEFIGVFSGGGIKLAVAYFVLLTFIFFYVNKITGKNIRSIASFNFLVTFLIGVVLFLVSLLSTGEQSEMMKNIVRPSPGIFITMFILGFVSMFTLPRQFNVIRADLKTNYVTYLKVIIVCFAIFIPLFHLISPYTGWGGYLFAIDTGKNFDLKAFAVMLLILGAAFSTIGPQLNTFTRILHEGVVSKFFRKTKSALKWSFISSLVLILIIIFLFGIFNPLLVDAYKGNIPAEYSQIKSSFVLSQLYYSSLIFMGIFAILLFGGLYWKKANKIGAMIGFITSFAAWIMLEILPQFTNVQILHKFLKMSYGQGWYPLISFGMITGSGLICYVLFSLVTPRDAISLVNGYVAIDDAGVEFFISDDIQHFMMNTAKTPLKMELIAYFKDNSSNQYTVRDLLIRLFWKGDFHDEEVEKGLKELAELEILKEMSRKNVRYYQYNFLDKPTDEVIENFTRSYYTAKQLFYKQAEEEFNRQSELLRREKEKLSDEVGLLEVFMEISGTLSQVLELEKLYKKVAELATRQLGFDSTEIYIREKDNTFSLKEIFYSNYTHLTQSDDATIEMFKNDVDKQKQLQNIVQTKEPYIMNQPGELSTEDKSVFAIFPIKEEGEVRAFLEVGYAGKNKTIADKDLNKLNIFVNTVELTFASVRLFEGLEEKVRQRTAQLNKANEDMKELNTKLEAINKEMKRERKVASQIQQAIVPKEMPKEPRMRLGYFWVPMTEVSGDYFDVISIGGGKYGILIADVSGHGVPSALITTMAKISFINHSKPGVTTADICGQVNKEIYAALGDIGFYLTAFFGILDVNTREFMFTNAGHEPGYWIQEGITGPDEIIELDSPGFFIGSFDGAEYGYNSVTLNPGDKVLFFTDGIVEARNPEGEFYEDHRLRDLLITYQSLGASEIARKLIDSVEEFSAGRPANDDRTSVVLELTKPRTSTPKGDMKEKDEKISEFVRLFNEGSGYYKEEKYNSAIESFEKALKIAPHSAQVYTYLGHIYRKQKEYPAALENYQQAIALKDNLTEAHNSIGVVYFYIQDYNNALKHFEIALKLNPGLKSAKENIEKIKQLVNE